MSGHVAPLPELTGPAKVTTAIREKHGARIETIMARYPVRRSGVMAVLYIVQEDHGWVPPETVPEIAEICEMTTAEVMEMVSFYTMYHRRPVGKYVLWVCGTLPCALCGADGLIDYLREKLGADVDEKTADGLFTIKRAECLGACSEAPLMLVNKSMETKLTRAKVDAILASCRAGTYNDKGAANGAKQCGAGGAKAEAPKSEPKVSEKKAPEAKAVEVKPVEAKAVEPKASEAPAAKVSEPVAAPKTAEPAKAEAKPSAAKPASGGGAKPSSGSKKPKGKK